MRQLIFDRLEGKALQALDLNPEGNLPVTFTLSLGHGVKPA